MHGKNSLEKKYMGKKKIYEKTGKYRDGKLKKKKEEKCRKKNCVGKLNCMKKKTCKKVNNVESKLEE